MKLTAIILFSLPSFLFSALAREKPAALQQLESAFENELAKKKQALYDPYQKALNSLYQQKIKSGKLEEALAVKREMERLLRTIPPSESTPIPGTVLADKNGNFLLLAKNAILQGNIQYDKPSGKLIEWKKSGSATWTLSNLPHGTYQATLNYHSGPFAGGTVSLNIGPSSGIYPITGSGKWKDKKTLEFNEFEITKPNYSFVISALASRAQGIMELDSIVLSPVDKSNTDQ